MRIGDTVEAMRLAVVKARVKRCYGLQDFIGWTVQVKGPRDWFWRDALVMADYGVAARRANAALEDGYIVLRERFDGPLERDNLTP